MFLRYELILSFFNFLDNVFLKRNWIKYWRKRYNRNDSMLSACYT